MCPVPRTNELLLFARHELVDHVPAGRGPAVLLEGSWPEGTSPQVRWSLDDEIDARFQWIDREASRLAERLAEPCLGAAEKQLGDCPDFRAAKMGLSPSGIGKSFLGRSLAAGQRHAQFHPINPAWLNALSLRYYLVKLIRLVAYFTEVRPLRTRDSLRLVAAKGRDEDYAHCIAELCRLAAADCRVQWIDRPKLPRPLFPPNSRWRRGVARLLGLLERRGCDGKPPRRVVLCGNPRLLDPICRELLRRGSSVFWLYDRFSLRSWLRWSISGVGQLVCDSIEGRANRLVHPVPDRLECRGVDLAAPVTRWIAGRLRTHGPRQTRVLAEIDAHFRRVRPCALVLDEDATPLARAAVALARRHGATSFVVQHGAPICRFGFAPPAADRVLVWGRSSEMQLARWGVPAERVEPVGSPGHEALRHALWRGLRGRFRARAIRTRTAWGLSRFSRSENGTVPFRNRTYPTWQDRPPRILLLATVPPRDDRPDAVALHLTRRSYAGMLQTALAGVATIPHAQLVVKLHPRAPDDPIAHAVLSGFPSVESRVVKRGPLARWLRWADCVLSCISSAGVDATLAGVPVIQLLPAGSGDVLPHEQWGMLGTARSEAELQRLLLRATDAREQPGADPDLNVFVNLDGSAAARIVDAILAPGEVRQAGRLGVTRLIGSKRDRMNEVTTNG